MLWLYYALLTKDVLLLSINAIACVVQSVYIIIYAPKEAKVYLVAIWINLLYNIIYLQLASSSSLLQAFTVKLLCTMNVALYGVMVAFLQFYVQGRRRVSVAGGIGAAFAFAVFVAPLAIIVSTTISGSSVDYLPTIVSRTY
jgi:solute carrier family 50 (sugar transporter)